jgi:Pretoxin HINT domain
MPIESSFNVRTNSDGSVHYVHSLYREGPDNDWSSDSRLALIQHDYSRFFWDWDTGRVEERDAAEDAAVYRQKVAEATRYQNRYAHLAAATEWQVLNANRRTEAINSRILPVLSGATGEKFGDNPRAWWEWWYDHNEYYTSDERPVERQYYSDYDTVYYPPEPPPAMGGHSCFPKGTPVWTKTGQQPIESLELGDLVLAQNVDTGELAYQPVVRRTVRPPSPISKLSFGDEQLQVTGSHPMWVSGVGWRMAKELGDGTILHALTGAMRVSAVEQAGEAEAYNLSVANFNTYFVGETGVLVHDVTHRRPTRATNPGVVLKNADRRN